MLFQLTIKYEFLERRLDSLRISQKFSLDKAAKMLTHFEHTAPSKFLLLRFKFKSLWLADIVSDLLVVFFLFN